MRRGLAMRGGLAERGGSPSLLSSTLAALFGSRGRNREVTGSNPGRDELDTDPIVVAAFEDNSFSARGAGTVRTWFNERVSRLGFHDEDGKKHKTFKTRSEKESSRGPPTRRATRVSSRTSSR